VRKTIGIAVAVIAFAAILIRAAHVPIWAAVELLVPVIPLMAAVALTWFVFHMCLAPRLRLKKLQRIRVRQGRRHPLA